MRSNKTAIFYMSEQIPYICILRDEYFECIRTVTREECTLSSIENFIPKDCSSIICITPEQEDCPAIFSRWQSLLVYPQSPQEILYSCGVYSQFKNRSLYSIDKGSLVVLSMALDNQYYTLSTRAGIILIYAGVYRSLVLSMYQGKIYGMFGFCSALIEREELLYCLEQFKHRWLPSEYIQDMGGCGSILIQDTPEEAIFSTIYCMGTRLKKYEGYAQCLPYNQDNCYIEKSLINIVRRIDSLIMF